MSIDAVTESILLDVDLFVKYKSVDKALSLLHESIDRNPRSVSLREKMREVCAMHQQTPEAARQCLALASLYINREEFDLAYDRLQEAKQFDPRISIAPGLEAIRRARHPEFAVSAKVPDKPVQVHLRRDVILMGDLSYIGIFDAIQAIENSKLTGLMVLKSEDQLANIAFNAGKIVDAEAQGETAEKAIRHIVNITGGSFEFTTSEQNFSITIQASSNTNLLLDTLSELDEENRDNW